MPLDLDHVLKSAQNSIRGPGGAIAIIQQGGDVVTQHVWGYADMDRAIPMRPQTQIPICSISKQMVCLVMVDLIRNPTAAMVEKGEEEEDVGEQLQAELERLLPQLAGRVKVQHLCNSGCLPNSTERGEWSAVSSHFFLS